MTEEKQLQPVDSPMADHNAEDMDRFFKFLGEFNQESDRAAVILGAARLDETLYQLLSATLVPSTSARDELLDSDGPLGTFSARIHVAYRLGLLDAEMTRALHLVRRIRNSFAHEVGGCTLDTGAHADRVKELAAPFRRYKQYAEARSWLDKQEHSGLSAEFRTIIAVLSLRIEGGLADSTRIAADPISLIPPIWMSPVDTGAKGGG